MSGVELSQIQECAILVGILRGFCTAFAYIQVTVMINYEPFARVFGCSHTFLGILQHQIANAYPTSSFSEKRDIRVKNSKLLISLNVFEKKHTQNRRESRTKATRNGRGMVFRNVGNFRIKPSGRLRIKSKDLIRLGM
jgi:hypothetical protein